MVAKSGRDEDQTRCELLLITVCSYIEGTRLPFPPALVSEMQLHAGFYLLYKDNGSIFCLLGIGQRHQPKLCGGSASIDG